mmetsp:Transcript_3774/g.9324  ORF Transcript_3774/g.9324 Transcript_3774/m.9324 type:complete len:86 (+) Transcript_3774:1215-1472(+)
MRQECSIWDPTRMLNKEQKIDESGQLATSIGARCSGDLFSSENLLNERTKQANEVQLWVYYIWVHVGKNVIYLGSYQHDDSKLNK